MPFECSPRARSGCTSPRLLAKIELPLVTLEKKRKHSGKVMVMGRGMATVRARATILPPAAAERPYQARRVENETVSSRHRASSRPRLGRSLERRAKMNASSRTATMARCTTTRQRWARGHMHSLSLLMPLAIAIACLAAACHGFRSIAWHPAPSTGRASVSHPLSSSSRVGPLALSTDAKNEKVRCRNARHMSGPSSTSGLFPQREAPAPPARSISSALMSSNDESSGDVSDGASPLAKVWTSLRKLLAKLWNLLLKPFRLLQSILTKAENGEDETKTKEEPMQEGVAITEVENIAAVEEATAEEVRADAKEVAKDEVKVEEQTIIPKKETETKAADAVQTPRQATAATDLSGNWTLIVDDAFTSQYDEYLRRLGQPMLVRTVALTVIGSTREETVQTDDGQRLFIRGTNVRGSWERELEASEQTVDDLPDDGERENVHAVEGHVLKPMTTADGEEVEVASWWERNGNVHHSWVVGGKKYGGGDFENKRYLTDEGNILVCESTFHPEEEGREDARVTWRFLREGAIYGDAAVQLPNIFDVLKKEEASEEEASDNLPSAGVVVGDIMDDVTSSGSVDGDSAAMIEEAIERESWVPPAGDRWAISAPGVDLSGKWKIIVTEDFKRKYEQFLLSLGQPLIVRGAAVVLIGNTREMTKQSDGGRTLYIKGINAKGIWERTLISSGSDFDSTMVPNVDGSYKHVQVPIESADSERVVAESYWENDGQVHVSWTRKVKKYGGGAFESKRYLENDGNVYVCESTFHPNDPDREKSFLKWKFLREGSALLLKEK